VIDLSYAESYKEFLPNGKSCKRARNAIYENAEPLACSPVCCFHQFAVVSRAAPGSLWQLSVIWRAENANAGKDDLT
jgi:hypothetical protein